MLRDALKQDTERERELFCILLSVMALNHRKPPIPEDLRLHVLNPNLVTGVSSAIARNVSPPGASAIRKTRVGVIVWVCVGWVDNLEGESDGPVLGPITSLKHLRQEHVMVRAPRLHAFSISDWLS